MDWNNAELSYLTALSVVDSLVNSGVQFVVASPGFRNSPLALAIRQSSHIKTITAVDERGAAFLAMGLSKSSHTPAAVICTSGSAVANYTPAVLEAHHSNTPLIIISADRPAELVGTGANQCADQIHFFGNIVRNFQAIEPAGNDAQFQNHTRYAVAKAVSASLGPQPGPVHINIRFREPFFPTAEMQNKVSAAKLNDDFPFKVILSAAGPSKEQADAIHEILKNVRKPMVLIGPQPLTNAESTSLAQFLENGIIALAENSSGILFTECGKSAAKNVDKVLAGILNGTLEAPDTIIRIGAPVLAKNFSKVLEKFKPLQIVFDEYGECREPDLYPSIFIQGGVLGWLDYLASLKLSFDGSYKETYLKFDTQIETQLDTHIEKSGFTEWFVQRNLEPKFGDEVNLFLGNSMPIRDFHSVFPKSDKDILTFTNRGQSGIDGLIASSIGIALGNSRETHAILGDLSSLHDLPSLSLLNEHRQSLNYTLWVMNNNGGEIFRMVATNKASHPEWFTTPQQFNLSAIAKAFQLSYLAISSKEQFAELNQALFSEPGVRLIEVMVDEKFNLAVRKDFS